MIKLLVLDRDGVINHESVDFIKSADEWKPIAGSLDAIARLVRAGYTVAVATNQSGVGRGIVSLQDLAAIHQKMQAGIEAAGGRIDKIVFCPHLPGEGCDCRKPAPGLLQQLADHYDVSMSGVPVIGDSLRDLDAAVAIGARPCLVLTGNGITTRQQLDEAGREVETYDDLATAVTALLAALR